MAPAPESKAGLGTQRATPLCFVGLGEVCYQWMRSLIGAGYPREALVALYLEHGSGRSATAVARARDLGVTLAGSPVEVPPATELFIHATAPAAARRVFGACEALLRPGRTWADLNSAGPTTKAQMADQAGRRGASFVDGAIMAPAWKHGHRTPVWISGPGCDSFVRWARRWGTPTVLVGQKAGMAARVKMCRSLIVKGIAASIIEGLLLAELNGVAGNVVDSLRQDFGAEVIDMLCGRLVPGTARHASRRAGEMPGVREVAAECRWEPRMLVAIAESLEHIAALGSHDIAAGDADHRAVIAELAQTIRARLPAR